MEARDRLGKTLRSHLDSWHSLRPACARKANLPTLPARSRLPGPQNHEMLHSALKAQRKTWAQLFAANPGSRFCPLSDSIKFLRVKAERRGG